MSEHRVSREVIDRLKKYLSSKEYVGGSDYSKSEYWKYHSKAIDIDMLGNKIIMKGDAGFYVPSKRVMLENISMAIKSPSTLFSLVQRKLEIGRPRIKLMNYFEAFDSVMKHDAISDPVSSPYRINFKELWKKRGGVGSISEMQKVFFAKDRYRLNAHMVMAYYFYNILQGYIDLTQVKTVLEIGAGSGNLAALLHKLIDTCTIVIVDLPETICLSIIFLSELFPEARTFMPHEKRIHDKYDFVFLTPGQIHEIEDDHVDLAINIHSFQEMTCKQVREYFHLVQQCCKEGAHFFVSNRVEKIPYAPDCDKETFEPPQRFSDYPWVSSNNVLIYEICRLTRLVQLDDVYIRLEQIKKEL
jgi:putative sugar O-methyltransferase